MTKILSVLVGCCLVGLVGCATQQDVANAKAEALQAAAVAQTTADSAVKCCEDNRLRLERMYQKLMSK